MAAGLSGADEAARGFYLRAHPTRAAARTRRSRARQAQRGCAACVGTRHWTLPGGFHASLSQPAAVPGEDAASPADAPGEDQLYVFWFYLVW